MIKKLHYLIVPIVVTVSALSRGVEWSLIQWLIALSMAVIIRVPWINKKLKEIVTFEKDMPLFHIHTFIIAIAFNYHFVWALGWYLAFILSSVVVNNVPSNYKKLSSILITIVAIAVNVFVFKPPVVFEWVIPLLYVNNIIVKKSEVMNIQSVEA